MKFINKIMSSFIILIITVPILTVSCSHYEIPIERTKLSSYYEDYPKPKTLLNGSLRYNPKRFDELKQQMIDSIKLKKVKNEIQGTIGDHILIFVHKDVIQKTSFNSIPVIKKALIHFIKDNNFSNSMLEHIVDINFVTKKQSQYVGTYLNHSIDIAFVLNDCREILKDAFNPEGVLLHEWSHYEFDMGAENQDKEINKNSALKRIVKIINRHDKEFPIEFSSVQVYPVGDFPLDDFFKKQNYNYYHNTNKFLNHWKLMHYSFDAGVFLPSSRQHREHTKEEMFESEYLAQLTSAYTSTVKTTGKLMLPRVGPLLVAGQFDNYTYFDSQKPYQSKYIMEAIFKEFYSISGYEKISFINTSTGWRAYFSSIGTPFTKKIKNIIVHNNKNKTEIKKVLHKEVPFGFHGRLLDDKLDYKYITDSATINFTSKQRANLEDFWFEIELFDGTKIPYKNIVFLKRTPSGSAGDEIINISYTFNPVSKTYSKK